MSYRAAPETPTPPPTNTSTFVSFLIVATLTPKPSFIEPGLSRSTIGELSVTSSKRDQEHAETASPHGSSNAARQSRLREPSSSQEARIRNALPGRGLPRRSKRAG